MADEAIYAAHDAIDVVREEAASLALMKITKHGGVIQVRDIATIFGAANLGLSMAIYFDLIAAVAATRGGVPVRDMAVPLHPPRRVDLARSPGARRPYTEPIRSTRLGYGTRSTRSLATRSPRRPSVTPEGGHG